MPPVSGRHVYTGPNQFESFSSRGMKPSNSPSSTGSLSSSDNARVSPATPDRAMRIPPRKYNGSPSRDDPSDKDVRMHTRTNFTKSYVPPVVTSSPGHKGYPSPRYSTNPFDEDDDAPDDEIRDRTVRPLRPDRYYAATDDVPTSTSRPEAYISETDESSMHNGTRSQESFGTRSRESSQVSRPIAYMPPLVTPDAMEARHAEDAKNSPTCSYDKEARHADEVKNSPILSYAKEAPSAFEEVKTSPRSSPQGRRRKRRKDKRNRNKPKAADAPTSDCDRFEEDEKILSKSEGDELGYYSTGDLAGETEEYQEFGDGSNMDDPTVTVPVSILKRGAPAKSSDDDSLFDFEGRKKERGNIRKVSLKASSRRERRPRRQTQEADDEESLEQDYGVVRPHSSSLQDRTQQAWTFRSQRSYSVEKNDSTRRDKVQFEQNDTVHHFNDDETNVTVQTSRSMNSMYTKSPESEAEDLIKDIFFIGSGIASNPGRRKIKYQPSYKRDLKLNAETAAEDGTLEGTLDDTTLGTTDDVTLNTLDNETTAFTADDVSLETSPRKSDGIPMGCSSLDPVKKVVQTQEDDPLSVVWSFFETVSAVIGLTPSTEEPEKDAPINDDDSPVKKKAPARKEAPVTVEAPAKMEVPTKKEVPTKMEVPSTKNVPTKKQMPLKTEAAPETSFVPEMAPSSSDDVPEAVKDSQGSFTDDVLGYLFGATAPAASPGDKEKDDKDVVSSTASVTTSSTTLEEDPRLEELALHAVRAKHELHDMKFDESVPIDIVKDIKFSLVRMALPLGILFHENDGGCWITKVFPDGNAAKVGGVEVGDQLAAVNGISAIMLRVDQICTLITEAPNPRNIELTFLRYIGELYPLQVRDSVVQEQCDITDKQPLRGKNPPGKVRSLRPKGNGHAVEPKQATSVTMRNNASGEPKRGRSLESKVKSPVHSQQFPSQQAPESKRKFKLFGRGKKK